ncbi:MAG: hypothetical protein ACREFP_16385 [Acetobacteraceae bacterium]
MTAARVLIRSMAQQQTTHDGTRVPLFAGIWAIFGHGNVAGRGEGRKAGIAEIPHAESLAVIARRAASHQIGDRRRASAKKCRLAGA